MKKVVLIAVIITLVLTCFGCTTNDSHMGMKIEEIVEKNTFEEEKDYPMDDNGSVQVTYAQELLKKKIEGAELSEVDEKLIDHCFVNEDIGIALVDARTIGMQKVVSQIYRTTDGGKTWDLLDDQFFFNSGAYNCINTNDKLIISNFASVTQSNIFIIIDLDGNINTVSSEEVIRDIDLTGLYAEMRLTDDGSHITCNWVKDYNSEEIIYVSLHNKEFATLSLKKYD